MWMDVESNSRKIDLKCYGVRPVDVRSPAEGAVTSAPVAAWFSEDCKADYLQGIFPYPNSIRQGTFCIWLKLDFKNFAEGNIWYSYDTATQTRRWEMNRISRFLVEAKIAREVGQVAYDVRDAGESIEGTGQAGNWLHVCYAWTQLDFTGEAALFI